MKRRSLWSTRHARPTFCVLPMTSRPGWPHVESDVTINGQEAGVEYEYRVIAANKTGEGPASNVVRVVL